MFVGGSNNIQMEVQSQAYEMANLESQPSSYNGIGSFDNTLVKHLKSSGLGQFDSTMSLQLYGDKTAAGTQQMSSHGHTTTQSSTHPGMQIGKQGRRIPS